MVSIMDKITNTAKQPDALYREVKLIEVLVRTPHIADGIIVMGDVERMGHLLRFLQVVKMRGTSHSRAKHAIELTPLGVMLTPMLKWGAVSDKTSRWGS